MLRVSGDYRKELQLLYARKSAVDRLIRSLEQYRVQAQRATALERRRKSA
ncbi:MAG TPA: hypothetical protein VKX45_10600 [Bryobacteraceae bacterium]|jgi:hypothetical protein|nr:hypothetical protein [Bryobacteraceae bacterium]